MSSEQITQETVPVETTSTETTTQPTANNTCLKWRYSGKLEKFYQ